MPKRLIKVAKELNVGVDTIVSFLQEKGHAIDNRPTTKIDDEQERLLVVEFSNSIAEKEQADKLRDQADQKLKQQKLEAEAIKKPLFKEKPKEEVKLSSTPPPPPKVEAQPVVEAKVETPEPEVIEKAVEEAPAQKVEKTTVKGPKVLGKIDLTPKKKKVKEEPKVEQKEPEKTPVAKPEPVAEVEKSEETPASQVTDTEKAPVVAKEVEKTVKPEEKLLRAKTPQLAGLKIQGKIDIKKFEPKKKKEDSTNKTAAGDRPRRKRKRKKIVREQPSRGGNNRGGNRRQPDEPKEVSQKEIDDKIKATMARLQGGTKNKRQKIRRDSREQKREKQEAREVTEDLTALQVTEFISVSELAGLLDVTPTDIITTCFNLGVIVSINQRLDAEIIELVVSEYDREVEFISAEEDDLEEEEVEDNPEDLVSRAPIVTVMGHVDHGKTSLLDYIRETSVVTGEAGGITQHIGAYEVKVNGKKITFLDTPGHEAFTAMRARGAKVTDIAVVIVAADDNVKPQTREALSHAQAAGVPIIFAINKIDKEGANPEKIKEELSKLNFLIEDWGGKYQSQDISAKQGTNIDALLEKILLEAELLDLKANPNRNATGAVLEASLEKGRGYATKTLVQNGTLQIGDSMLAGNFSGKVKAMFNDKGKKVKEAGPSTPVLILGLGGAPQAGEKFKVLDTEQEAKQIATRRQQITREQSVRANKRISLDEIGRRLALGSFKELNLIVKGDFDGSVEALSDSLIKLSVESVQINVIHRGVGPIVESDILLASASDAIVIGFQVRPLPQARELAEKEGVEIKTYSVIYQAIDEIKLAMEGLLEPTTEEKVIGQVEVRETYKISKIGTIAGCYVQEGVIKRNSHIRIIRDNIVIYPTKEGVIGEIASLKRFKDDVKEVKAGFECGLSIKGYNDLQEGDMIEVYEIVEVKQTL